MADNMTTLQILQGIHDWVLDKIDEETANFITKTVNDLVNYYTKSETYTKAEVQQIVDAIKQFTYEVVQVLPTASASTMNKIYLVPAPKSEDKNVKEEYITIQNGSTYSWEMLGTTSIDLSNYYTKGQTDSAISSALSSALASYTTTTDLTTLLAQKQDVIQDLAAIRSGASTGATAVQPSTLNSALSDTVAESGVYDVTANNNNAKFASLSALLGSENLDTLIPSAKRKGGMSIKFVQSSDNKYVQYRLTTDEWSIDTKDWAIADEGVYLENPEFVYVKTDAEGKILWAIKADGTVYFGAGVPPQVVDYIQQKIEELSLDEYENIVAFLNGLEEGDKTLQQLLNEKVDKEESKSLIDEEYASTKSTIDNPEFIEAKTDSEGKVLAGRTTDGAAFENVGFSTPKVSIDGQTIKNIEDPEERSEVTTDSEGKIISYRGSDGVKHENVGIETDNVNTEHLNLTDTGMTEFQQALKNSGFQPGGAGDWSDKDSMYIPEPRLAHLNIITNFNLVNLTKTSDVKCAVEFFDGAGNYFKKWIILNGQGRSSLSFLKKGLGADFFNEDPNSETFDEDNVFSMKFGDWVYQDSFHIKSYYTDWPRCTTPVVYKLTDEVVRTRGLMNDRPYKKYYVGEYSDAANANTQSDLDKNMETGARCFPDGFPVIVYQNGEFWGVNAWQLKKHRDNYMLSKKKANHIYLDGDMGTTKGQTTAFWLYNGNIDWTAYCSGAGGIETRNPKNLYCVDGKKYDADTHDAEIITTATAEEWIAAGQIIPTGKVIDDTLAGYLRTTGKVRKSIEDLTTYVPTIRQIATISTNNGDIMIGSFGGNYDVSKNFGKGVWVVSEGRNYMSIHSSNTGNPVTDINNWVDVTDALADVKETIEDMFDLDTFIDFIVIGNVCGNNDAWDNNGQIITWGKLDGSDRLNWSVNMYDCDITFGCQWNGIVASAANNVRLGSTYPLYKIFWDYYFNELKARYHELRDKGIFDAEHITQLFRSWMDRVGYDNYVKEYKKWNESPCFRDGSQTYINYPTSGGFYGSIERIYLWIKKRIQYMDAADFFNYNQN